MWASKDIMTLFVQDKSEYNVESTSTPDLQICLFISSVVFKPVWPFRPLLALESVEHAYPQNLGDPIIDEATPGIQGYFPAEGPYGFCGLYDSFTDGTPTTQGRLLGEASTFGDWAVFEDPLIDPLVDNGFYSHMLPQPDPFLTQPSYPTAGLGQVFKPIAPGPAAAVPPNIIAAPSRAPPVARRRTVQQRFQCNIDGCTKAYRRVGDCRRHMRKHQAPKLRCVVEGCNMKFDRMDKLRDHVRQGHKMNL